MTAMLTRIRLQAEGATVRAVQANLFAASDAIHALVYGAHVVPPHPLSGEHYEQAEPPDRFHTRWYHGRAHLDFPLDHHAVDVDQLRGRGDWVKEMDVDHGTFAALRYEAREYAWEGTATAAAHQTYGVYDTASDDETSLVTGGLTKDEAERGAAALNMTARDARSALYHAAMPRIYQGSSGSGGVFASAITTTTSSSSDEPPDAEASRVPRVTPPGAPSGSASVPLPGQVRADPPHGRTTR